MYYSSTAFRFSSRNPSRAGWEKLILKSDKALKYLMDRIEAIKEVTRLAKDFYIPVFAHNTALDFSLV